MNDLLLGKTKITRSTAILLLAATALLWSFGGLLIKLVSWNPIAISGARSAIAAILIWIILRRPKFTWSFPQVAGAIAYAVTVLLFVPATKLTTAANAILLQYTAPIYVAVLGVWLLKERLKAFDIVTMILSLGGMVLFFMDNLSAGSLLGNILAILSGVSFALTTVFMRMQKNGSALETVLLGNIITALIGVPFMLSSVPSTSSIMGMVMLGIFQLGIAYVLYSIGIKYVTALDAILIATIEPVLNPVWVFLAIGEKPGKWAIIGGLIVLGSVTLRSIITVIKAEIKPDGTVSPVQASQAVK